MRPRTHGDERGTSVVELVVTITLLAAVLALAIPALAKVLQTSSDQRHRAELLDDQRAALALLRVDLGHGRLVAVDPTTALLAVDAEADACVRWALVDGVLVRATKARPTADDDDASWTAPAAVVDGAGPRGVTAFAPDDGGHALVVSLELRRGASRAALSTTLAASRVGPPGEQRELEERCG